MRQNAPARTTVRERVKSPEMSSDRGSSAGGKTADESAAAGLLIAGSVCLAVALLLQFVADGGMSVLVLKIVLLAAAAIAFVVSLRRAEMRRRELASLVRAMQESAEKREAEVVTMRDANERTEAASAAKSELLPAFVRPKKAMVSSFAARSRAAIRRLRRLTVC